jgi:hypothetical protein
LLLRGYTVTASHVGIIHAQNPQELTFTGKSGEDPFQEQYYFLDHIPPPLHVGHAGIAKQFLAHRVTSPT